MEQLKWLQKKIKYYVQIKYLVNKQDLYLKQVEIGVIYIGNHRCFLWLKRQQKNQ